MKYNDIIRKGGVKIINTKVPMCDKCSSCLVVSLNKKRTLGEIKITNGGRFYCSKCDELIPELHVMDYVTQQF